MSSRNILLYFCSSLLDYFLTLFIKYFKMGLARSLDECLKHFQVVVPEQLLSLLVLVLFGQNELCTGCFLPINLEEFFFL